MMIVTNETSAHKEAGAPRNMYTQTELDAAVADERERCAKICEAQEYAYWRATEDQDFTPQDCADAIRRA